MNSKIKKLHHLSRCCSHDPPWRRASILNGWPIDFRIRQLVEIQKFYTSNLINIELARDS